MADRVRWVTGTLTAWAVFGPFWLIVFWLLAWGRVRLSRAELRRAVVRIAVVSACLVPAAGAVYAYCAGFNPSPSVSRAVTGSLWAAMLLPVYSAVVAFVVFEFVVQDALKRGALRRGLLTRIAAGIALLVLLTAAVGILGVACFFAAGPQALG